MFVSVYSLEMESNLVAVNNQSIPRLLSNTLSLFLYPLLSQVTPTASVHSSCPVPVSPTSTPSRTTRSPTCASAERPKCRPCSPSSLTTPLPSVRAKLSWSFAVVVWFCRVIRIVQCVSSQKIVVIMLHSSLLLSLTSVFFLFVYLFV